MSADRADGLYLRADWSGSRDEDQGLFCAETPRLVRLHEKGGEVTDLPCNHNLEVFLDDWIAASGLAGEADAPLFPTLKHGRLAARTPLPPANVHVMI